MTQLQIALEVLLAAEAAADALARARKVYNAIKEQAARTQEFTPEETAALHAKAELIFNSPAQAPSGR